MQINQALTPSDTYRVVLERDEDGGEKSGFVIVGPDSDEARAEKDRQRIAGLREKAQRKGKTINVDTEKGALEFDAKFQDNMTNIAAAVTVGWFGFTDGEGNSVEFSRETVAKIYEARNSWRDMVLAANDKAANFLPKSAQD